MATCRCRYSWVSSYQVAAPCSSPSDLKAKLISIWPVSGFNPPEMGRFVSISLPVRRLPCTSSACPTSSGAEPRMYFSSVAASQATNGLPGSSLPAMGSNSWPHCKRLAAAICIVGSSDCRSARSISVIFWRRSAASIEFFASPGAFAETFGASTLFASSGTGLPCASTAVLMVLARSSSEVLACSGVITPSSTHRLAISSVTFISAAVSGMPGCSTGRNSSCEVCPKARAWEVSSPGTVITRVLPSAITLAPVTPMPLTRFSRIVRACANCSWVGSSPCGTKVTRVPPCRSMPRLGLAVRSPVKKISA